MYTIAEVLNKGADIMIKINKMNPRPEKEDMLNEVYESIRKIQPLTNAEVCQIKETLKEMADNFY